MVTTPFLKKIKNKKKIISEKDKNKKIKVNNVNQRTIYKIIHLKYDGD